MELTNKASQFQHTCWEKCDITVWPVITCIYLCGNCMQPACLSFFSNLPSVTVHSLNGNVRQAWKNLCTIGILSNKDSWCLVPNSNNISCDCPQSISVLARITIIVPYISQWYYIVIFLRDTQQENSATKHAIIRWSCDCSALWSEWGFVRRNVDLWLLRTVSRC